MSGLRIRIAGLLAIACAVVAVVVGAIGYRSTEARLVDELDRSLEQVSTLIVGGVNVGGGANQGRVPTRVLGDVYSARQIDLEGAVTRTNFLVGLPVGDEVIDEVAGAAGVRRFSSVRADDSSRFRVLSIGFNEGVVQVARPLDETDNVLDDLAERTLLLVILTATIGAIVGAFAAGRVAAPLRRLATAAETVESSGRLDVDLGPEGGSDEVGRLRRSFGGMLDALSRSRSEQQRLVQDAGHELRTPLTSLRTNLAVLRRHTQMPDEMRAEVVQDLTAEVDELADLVDELVAAAQGDQRDEQAIEVDLSALAQTVADRVARRRGRQIAVLAPTPAVVAAGPLGLARAVTNVIENACKFDTTGGQIDVSVDLIAGTNEELVSFRVGDRGPGVPADERTRVFDRFHRVEATRTMPGSGLGLAIVRDVVERHGGMVAAEARPGGGAQIGFDLPAV